MTRYLPRPQGGSLAYAHLAGATPGVLFCPGFMSDMNGTKALHLEQFCRDRGRAMTRFDYSGHGASSGAFTDGTIGQWLDDALAVLDQVTSGPLVVVGSSMGGWIALLLARQRPTRVQALVLLAPAPDFTVDLFNREMTPAQRRQLLAVGAVERPSEYSEAPYIITRDLIEEGNAHRLLDNPPVAVGCPVHIVQGTADSDVHWRRSLRLLDALDGDEVELHLVKNADHRLSSDRDLARLTCLVERLW